MIVAVLANDELKKEFLQKEISVEVEIVWCDTLKIMGMVEADAYIDLLYRSEKERNELLARIKVKPVFINDVNKLADKTYGFIRLNAWPGFLKRDITELAVSNDDQEIEVKNTFEKLGWQYRVVPDRPGFVSARVVAMMINEAYYALGENVSSRDDIDTAMKLGTNYPYGPFEWIKLIGLKNVYTLLQEIAREHERYQPAPALKEEWETINKR